MKEFRDALIRMLDSSFLGMVNAINKDEYMYKFGQYNTCLLILFMEKMISFDEYNMMVDVKNSFYFLNVRNEVVFQ